MSGNNREKRNSKKDRRQMGYTILRVPFPYLGMSKLRARHQLYVPQQALDSVIIYYLENKKATSILPAHHKNGKLVITG
jgi:hypothetical protein